MRSAGGRSALGLDLRLGVAVAGLMAGLLVCVWSMPRNTTAAIVEPQYLASDKTLGSNVDLSRYGAEEREAVLQAMQAGGFRWLRQRFSWSDIEIQPGVYDWSVWDQIVEATARHGLELVAVLDGTPSWVRAPGDASNAFAPPADPRSFGAFAAALATRYADRLTYYQLWDEPNIAPHWGEQGIDPVGYAVLLREAAIQLRAADPEAVILLAALAPNVEPGGENMSELLFLDEVYQAGAREWFDVVAGQPYKFEAALGAPAGTGDLNWRRLDLLRAVMEANGDDGTAVWAVSFASCSPGQASESCADDPQHVTEAMEIARRDWPWLGPMLWAAWSPDDNHGGYSLTDEAGEVNATYGNLQETALSPAVAWPGMYPAEHETGRYEGGWRLTPSAGDIGQSGDRLQIRFQGTRLDLAVRRGNYRAFLFVTVDGQPANSLPRDSAGRAYVVLYDPLYQKALIELANGLNDGQHTAEIVAEGGWGQWAILGWTVSRSEGSSTRWLACGLGAAAMLVFAIAYLGTAGRPGSRLWTRSVQGVAEWVRATNQRTRTVDERLPIIFVGGSALLFWAVGEGVPGLVGLAVLTLLLVLWPHAGLPLVAVALPFYQLGRPLLGKTFSMVEILTLLTALGWLLNGLLLTRRPTEESVVAQLRLGLHRLTATDWAVVVLLVLGGASLLWAEHVREAAREYRTVLMEGALFYGLLRCTVVGDRDTWRVTDAWVLGGVLLALIGLLQWALGWNLIAADGVWRVRGFYGSPNNLALYLGRLLPLCVAMGPLFIVDHSPPYAGRHYAYAIGAIIMGAAMVSTFSRGSLLIGLPITLLFLAAVRLPRWRDRRLAPRLLAVLVPLLLLTLLLAVVLTAGPDRMTSLLDMERGTTFFRLQLWRSSLAMIRDHPLLGVGLDNFLYYYRSRYVLPTAWEEFDLSHPHNLVLDFWLRLGIAGLLVLGWLLVFFFRAAWGRYSRPPSGTRSADGALTSEEEQNRYLMLGLMASMVYILAHGVVDQAFFLVDLAFAFLLLLALVQTQGLGER